jgi:DNA-binding transcriptional ArsR family regulator
LFEVIKTYLNTESKNKKMTKNNLLLLDLNDTKTKKLAETITSDTSRKILNYLAEKDDTEANMSKILNIPISTVHYHLQKLQDAKLVMVEEFHYSPKGREVNHYKLANKYIIIAPRKVAGLKQKLKGILPVGLIALGISAVIKFLTSIQRSSFSAAKEMAAPMVEEMVADTAMVREAVPQMMNTVTPVQQPDIALWFLLGSIFTIVIYILIILIKEKMKK